MHKNAVSIYKPCSAVISGGWWKQGGKTSDDLRYSAPSPQDDPPGAAKVWAILHKSIIGFLRRQLSGTSPLRHSL
jgi:hypothetical protein